MTNSALNRWLLVALVFIIQNTALKANGHLRAEDQAYYESFSAFTENVYSGLDYLRFLILPIVTARVGGDLDGRRGALTGAAAACVDQLLDDFFSQSRYHLTSAFLGAASLSRLRLPFYLNYLTGAAAGLTISSGNLEYIKDYLDLPFAGIFNGLFYAGTIGGGAGALIGAADEILESQGVCEYPYGSIVVQSLARAKLLIQIASLTLNFRQTTHIFENSYFRLYSTSILGAILGALGIYSVEKKRLNATDSPTQDISSILNAITEPLEKILGPDVLRARMHRQAVIMVAIPLIVGPAALKLKKICTHIHQRIAGFETPQANTGTRVLDGISSLYPFLIYYAINELISNVFQYYESRLLSLEATDTMHTRFIEPEMPLRLAKYPQSSALLSRMDNDIYIIAAQGRLLLSKAISSQIQKTYGFSILYGHQFLDFGILSDWLDDLLTALENPLASIRETINEKIIFVDCQLKSLQREWHMHPSDIVYNQKQLLLAQKLNQLMTEKRKLNAQNWMLKAIDETFSKFSNVILHYVFLRGFITLKLMERSSGVRTFTFKDYPTILTASKSVLDANNWDNLNSARLIDLNQAQNNIQALLRMMNETTNDDKSLLSTKYQAQSSNQTYIALQNFSIGHSKTILIRNQDLYIPKGIYALTGKSGTGKTSFFSKIQRILHNNIWASGNITYGTPDGTFPSVYQSPQSDYWVPYSTLIESITGQANFDEILDPKLIQKLQSLLSEIKFDHHGIAELINNLKSRKDWRNILSGGQKRKIALISAILKKPDILLLDEIFNGLDQQSIKTAQKMIKKYLPDSLVLIVDHHYTTNNHQDKNGAFYNGRLHLENQVINFYKD